MSDRLDFDRLEYDCAAAVPAEAWRWPHFTPAEMACKATARVIVRPSFMDKLERLRVAFGKPMPIHSGYRSPEHNAAVSAVASTDGPHTDGAVDVGVHGADAYELVQLAPAHGFTGIGIAQKGPIEKRFVHLDDVAAKPDALRPLLWSY